MEDLINCIAPLFFFFFFLSLSFFLFWEFLGQWCSPQVCQENSRFLEQCLCCVTKHLQREMLHERAPPQLFWCWLVTPPAQGYVLKLQRAERQGFSRELPGN